MSNREVKTAAEQAGQTAPVETPEAAQIGSEPTVEPAAQQDEQSSVSAEANGDPAPDTPKRPQIVVTAPQGLNLREGPHVSYAVKAVLPDGTPVEILYLPEDVEVPSWALVKTCAGIGWVNTDFLRKVEP